MDLLYSVIVIQPRLRDTIRENLEHSLNLLDGAALYASLEIPARLAVFPEFFLQSARGAHVSEARKEPRQIRVPGEQTDLLGEKAKKHNLYVVGTAETVESDFPGYTFNVAFIVGPDGTVVHRYFKLMTTCNAMETNVSPHDIYDRFVDIHGHDLSAFFPVAETDIGRIGTFTCYDGNFPEVPRGLAMNGAEILVRPAAWPDPYTDEPMDLWTIQNRVRALDNSCYLIAVNQGGGGYMGTDINAGQSMVVDYKGRILAQTKKTGETLLYCTVSLTELREFRARARAFNFLPAIRSEVFAKIYERPVWPKNLWLDAPPSKIVELQGAFRLALEQLQRHRVYV